jgi:hypothetical protein
LSPLLGEALHEPQAVLLALNDQRSETVGGRPGQSRDVRHAWRSGKVTTVTQRAPSSAVNTTSRAVHARSRGW